MISPRIQRYTVFIGAPDSAGYGMHLRHLVNKDRVDVGRKPPPGYGIIDSQSVKTVGASEKRGIYGEKNKGQEATYSRGHNGELAACCCPRGKYPRYQNGNTRCKAGSQTVSGHRKVLC